MSLISHFLNVAEIPPAPAPLDLKMFPTHGAVVGLISDDDRLIQLFSTQNLRRAVQKRMSASDPNQPSSRRANVREVTRRVAWTPAYSVFENTWHFLELSRVLQPDSYLKGLLSKPAWFAGIQLADSFPRWTMDTHLFQRPLEIGPFRSKKSCTDFINRLENDFELCRKYEELLRAPSGNTCAYFDMGRCPAPCNGTASLASYRAQLNRSAAFAKSSHPDRLRLLRDEMNIASRALRFEQASFLKAELIALENSTTVAGDYRDWPFPVDNFRFLIIQRGSTRRRVKPFFADHHGIEEAEEAEIGNLEKVVHDWWLRLSSTFCSGDDNKNRCAERISLVVHFSRKRGRRHGLFVHRDDVVSPEALLSRLVDYLSPTTHPAQLSDNG